MCISGTHTGEALTWGVEQGGAGGGAALLATDSPARPPRPPRPRAGHVRLVHHSEELAGQSVHPPARHVGRQDGRQGGVRAAAGGVAQQVGKRGHHIAELGLERAAGPSPPCRLPQPPQRLLSLSPAVSPVAALADTF